MDGRPKRIKKFAFTIVGVYNRLRVDGALLAVVRLYMPFYMSYLLFYFFLKLFLGLLYFCHHLCAFVCHL